MLYQLRKVINFYLSINQKTDISITIKISSQQIHFICSNLEFFPLIYHPKQQKSMILHLLDDFHALLFSLYELIICFVFLDDRCDNIQSKCFQIQQNIMKSIQFSYQRSKEMAQTQYKLKTTRSRDDYQFFQVTLLKYDSQKIKDIYVDLAESQLIHSQEIFARIIPKGQKMLDESEENKCNQPLSIPFSGKVESISDHFEKIEMGGKTFYHLKQPQKKGNLPILSFRECDHIPREETFLNSNFAGQSTKKKSYSNTVAICDICQVTLWKYYDKEQVEISLGQICKVNSIIDVSMLLSQFSWSIAVNEQFTPTTQIGKVNDQEINLPYLAKASFLINFDQNRKKLRQNSIVIKIRKVICKHEKILEGRCQFCMEQVKQEHLNTFTSYFFQHETSRSNVLVTGSALKQHEQMYIESLLSNNKAMIILDLDNTILHSNEISELSLKNVLALKDFYLIPKIQCPYQEEMGKRDLIVVKMRPYFKHFIYVITKLYEIYVYTKGTRIYAQQICKYIRAQYAGQQKSHPYQTWQPQKLLFLQNKKSFTTNIISRDEDSNLQSKSFEKILPSKTQYHLILDDRRDVWNNSPSWFFTREYYYFFKKMKKSEENSIANDDISHYLSNQQVQMPEVKGQLIEEFKNIKQHYPQKKDLFVQTNEKDDYYLLFTAYALKKIHKSFFEALKTEKMEKQEGQKQRIEENHTNPTKARKFNKINLAYQYAKTKFFFKNMKFQCFLGEDQNENNNNTIRRAKKMGATITNESPKLIIRANDLMKQTKKPQLLHLQPGSEGVNQMKEQQNLNYYFQQKKELNDLFNKKIPVVSQSWIHYCYEFNYPFSYQEFKLFDPFQLEVNHEDYNHIVQKEAKLILASIEEEMAKELSGDHKKTVHIHPQPIKNRKEKHQSPARNDKSNEKSS